MHRRVYCWTGGAILDQVFRSYIEPVRTGGSLSRLACLEAVVLRQAANRQLVFNNLLKFGVAEVRSKLLK